jgi:transposase-like protein
MEITDTPRSTPAASGGDVQSSAPGRTEQGGGVGPRRKLSDQQEREVTRLYSETETPVSEISKRFGIGESSVYRVVQRHGAALRGRGPIATSPARLAPKAMRQPTAAGSTSGRAAATAGRRTGATPSRPAQTPAQRTSPTAARARAATASKSTAGAARPRAKQTATSTTARTSRATSAATRRSFRVSYVAVRVFTAASMADAIRQAEAAGVTDITSAHMELGGDTEVRQR